MTFNAATETGRTIAPLIDHTLLKAEAKRDDVARMCREAEYYGFATVCVPPCMVSSARELLSDGKTRIDTVVGFPSGYDTTETKVFETGIALANGADELDMVINVSALKDGNLKYVARDIKAVVKAAEAHTVKVILETCLLTDAEKETACRIVVDAGAHFVKTSTGLAGGGATVQDILLMRRTVGPNFGVKASGGIRSARAALDMMQAGATRIGTSSGVAIVTE